MDSQTTVSQLIEKTISFRNARGWQKNTAKDLAVSIVLEAAELLEHFQWGHYERKNIRQNKEKMQELSHELADVLIYLLAFASDLKIDISASIEEKLKWNAKKYPISRFNPHFQDREYYFKIKKAYRNKNSKIQNPKSLSAQAGK